MPVEEITVSVVLAMPTKQQKIELRVQVGMGAREAVLLAERLGLDFSGTGVNAESAAIGVYSERVDDDHRLDEGDRIEVYRALEQDPMDLRRQRASASSKKR